MSQPEEVADPDFFELMIARFTPKPRAKQCRIKTVGELDERLAGALADPMLAIGLTCVAEGVDWGSFLLLLNGERAWVHLMVGHCITARDPKIRDTSASVSFLDDAGVWHQMPFEATLSREQGLCALRHWLPRGEKLPKLAWGSHEPSATPDGGRDAGS
jgi:hypothetical protein